MWSIVSFIWFSFTNIWKGMGNTHNSNQTAKPAQCSHLFMWFRFLLGPISSSSGSHKDILLIKHQRYSICTFLELLERQLTPSISTGSKWTQRCSMFNVGLNSHCLTFFHCVFSYMLTQITCQVSELDRSEHKSVQRGRLQAAGRGVSVNLFFMSVNPFYVFMLCLM